MRRLAFLVPLLVGIVVLAGLSPAHSIAGGTISGMATDPFGTPLSGVRVTALPVKIGGTSSSQVTTSSGTFELSGLDAGDYNVCFDASDMTSGGASTTGYVDVCWKDIEFPGGERPTSLPPVTVGESPVTGIDQAVPFAAAVEGTVRDNEGNPIVGARVAASIEQPSRPSPTAVTDDTGRYRIDGLYPGAFGICASARHATGGSSTTGYLDSCHGGGYAQETFTGVAEPYNLDPADAVVIGAGVAATGVDITLPSAGRIEGTLTNTDGSPIAGVRVYGWGETLSGMSMEAAGTTDDGGHYVLDVSDPDGWANGLFHGTRLPIVPWKVFFSPPTTDYARSYYPHIPAIGGSAWRPAPKITPLAGAPTVLDDQLPFAGSIGGTVTDAAGAPLENVRVRVDIAGPGEILETSTEADGTYTVEGLPADDYTVCFQPLYATTGGSSQAGYFAACSGGSPASQPETVHLSAGQDLTDVGAALLSASRIQGVVRNASGSGIWGVRVLVKDAAGVEVSSYSSSFDGTYSSGPLPEGTYTVCFKPTGTASASYLAKCWSDGTTSDPTPIATTAGAVTKIDTELAAAPPPDTTAPVVTVLSPATLFATGRTIKVSYRAVDDSPAGLGHGVRYRSAGPTSTGFSSWVYPDAWQNLSGTSVSMTGTPGRTYCFSVRAGDAVGNLSAWSPERCRAVPLDDRSLTASRGWVRRTEAGAFEGTATRSSTPGATLRLTGASVTRLALVVTTCPTCGKVGVYVGSRLISTISTYSATTRRQVVRLASRIALTRGTVTLKVTQRRAVIVDGLIVTRR